MPDPLLTLYISGQLVKPALNSHRINSSLNQRDTYDVTVITHDNNVAAYFLGQTVQVTDGLSTPSTLFAGRIETITQATKKDVINIAYDKWWDLSCVSHEKMLDRFYAMGSWTGQTMGFIVRSLISKYLTADGMTASNVEDGPIIPQYDVTTPTRISDILLDLSRRTKFPFFVELINPLSSPIHTDLHMFDPGTGSNVFSLTDGTAVETIAPVCDLVAYRNRQNILTGTLNNSETFPGSGSAPQTVTLSQQASSVTSVEVDGSPKTVGISGTDTGKDWYYTVNGVAVVQDAAATAIPSSASIKVLYVPRTSETLHGDGTTHPITLNTTKPIASVTAITLNGSSQTVGVLGTDPPASNNWLYAENGTTIQQGTGPVLLLADNLVVDYEPVPGIITLNNTAEQTYRASIEGGSGIHEAYDTAVNGSTEGDALALGQELLAKFGVSFPGTGRNDVRELPFRLTTKREPTALVLRPGKRVGVNRVSLGITGNWLISSVAISEVPNTRVIALDVRLTRDRFIPDFEPFFDVPIEQATSSAVVAGTPAAPVGGDVVISFN